MQSSDQPDLPEGWGGPQTSPRVYVAITGLLAIAVVAALTGAVAAMSGNYAALRYSVLFGVMMALVAALGLAFRRISAPLSAQVRTVQHGDAVATEIRYSARQFWLLVALMACGALFCLGAAIEVFLRRGHDTFPGASLILGALGILFASYLIAVLLGRLCRGGITLSTKGIGQRGWSFESFLQWPAVAGVKPAYNGYPVILVIGYTNAEWPHRYTTRIWRTDRLPPVPMMEIDCRKFDVDPYTLYRYLRNYVENPAARGELGTPAALAQAR